MFILRLHLLPILNNDWVVMLCKTLSSVLVIIYQWQSIVMGILFCVLFMLDELSLTEFTETTSAYNLECKTLSDFKCLPRGHGLH